MRLCVNAFNRTIKFRIIRIFHLPRGYHVNPHVDLRQKAPQDRGVFVPPVAATDSFNQRQATVERESFPRRNYSYLSIS